MHIRKLVTGRLNPSGGWGDHRFDPDEVIAFAEAARDAGAKIVVGEVDEFERPHLAFVKEIEDE